MQPEDIPLAQSSFASKKATTYCFRERRRAAVAFRCIISTDECGILQPGWTFRKVTNIVKEIGHQQSRSHTIQLLLTGYLSAELDISHCIRKVDWRHPGECRVKASKSGMRAAEHSRICSFHWILTATCFACSIFAELTGYDAAVMDPAERMQTIEIVTCDR